MRCWQACDGFTTNKHNDLKAHLKLCHGGHPDYRSYRSTHGSLVTIRVIHECLVCKREVTHSSKSLASHMKSRHGMTTSEYYYNYVKAETLDVEM